MNNKSSRDRISLIMGPDGYIDITVPPALRGEFIQMVARANDTWQDRSGAMAEFSERIQHGRVLQRQGDRREPKHTPLPGTGGCGGFPESSGPCAVLPDGMIVSAVPLKLDLPTINLDPAKPVENFVGMNVQVDPSIPEGEVHITDKFGGVEMKIVSVDEAADILYEDTLPPVVCAFCDKRLYNPCDLELSLTCENKT